jgi:hypothetical protein
MFGILTSTSPDLVLSVLVRQLLRPAVRVIVRSWGPAPIISVASMIRAWWRIPTISRTRSRSERSWNAWTSEGGPN